MHENKRPELFLEVAKKLPRRRFVMIGGPGPNAAFYEEVRRACAAVSNVEFKGFLPLAEAESWFDRARVFVNTSLYEGMPNTFLQAWARGVPTVATVDVGVAAHRVAPTVDELAREIEAAWDDPSRGKACRRHYERSHSSAHVFERYDGLFRGILQ
jgi:glycosyltransferase involved in cell wall biosynthesis